MVTPDSDLVHFLVGISNSNQVTYGVNVETRTGPVAAGCRQLSSEEDIWATDRAASCMPAQVPPCVSEGCADPVQWTFSTQW